MKQRALLAILLALAIARAGPLLAENYSAIVEQLKTAFQSSLARTSPTGRPERAELMARLRQQLSDLESRAKVLDDLQSTITSARNRANAARNEWQRAQASSAAARKTLESNAATLQTDLQTYVKDFGDFMESWGLPRTGGQKMVPESQVAAFERGIAPLKERERRLGSRMESLTNDRERVEALEATTDQKKQAVQSADQDVTRLQDTLSAKAAAFRPLRISTEDGVRTVAAEHASALNGGSTPGTLAPFPRQSPAPDLAPLVRTVRGGNTKALDQLRAVAGDEKGRSAFNYDCYDSRCAGGRGVNGGGVSAPPAVAEKLANNPGYQRAKAAATAAAQRFDDVNTKLIQAERDPGTSREQLESLVKEQSKALAAKLMAIHATLTFEGVNLTPARPKAPSNPPPPPPRNP